MPTVRGVLRRGMTVEGLKRFIIAQGSSRSNVSMDWDKIWAFNKKVIDPISARYTALSPNPIPVNVKNLDFKCKPISVLKHPKNDALGMKEIWIGEKLLIDAADAENLTENENATFINWGNLKVVKINRDSSGKIVSVDVVTNLEDTNFKKTPKLTWLCETEKAPLVPIYAVNYDHIISKPLLGKDEDFKKYVGHETRVETKMIGDFALSTLKENDIIELQRRGFYRVDRAYSGVTEFDCKEQPLILIAIPDGTTKQVKTYLLHTNITYFIFYLYLKITLT